MKNEKRRRLMWSLLWVLGSALTGGLAVYAYWYPQISGLSWGIYALLSGAYLLNAILWLRYWLRYDKQHKDSQD